MSQKTKTAETPAELSPDEILLAYKKRFANDGKVNRSPFEEGRVIRFGDDVQAWDVPEIHHNVRQTIEEVLAGIHQGKPSQVVVLAGEPGMGKSHLVNHFRSPRVAAEHGYAIVCNSNHWRASEFEACLLDWILDAMVTPSPREKHLLLEKVKDLAFQALGQILSRPGHIRKFQGRKDAGALRRFWIKLVGSNHGRYAEAVQKRDERIFRKLDFSAFADFVCQQFLHDKGNPFHRYVMKVLLRYLFEEDREKSLHWLRRKNVHNYFLYRLEAEDTIDCHYKIMDVIKILLSLFTTDVSKELKPGAEERGKIFFFAFDQMEGRQELFEDDSDWFKFFAQLSELYNTLPNVFILFTMTLSLRDRLYPKMERQFQQRINRDQKFMLREIADDEVLSVYRRRIASWLGVHAELRALVQQPEFQYLPFTQQQILDIGRSKTLRALLDEFDRQFSRYMIQEVTSDNPRFEFQVARNECEKAIQDDEAVDHLRLVGDVMSKSGDVLARGSGLTLVGVERCLTKDELPVLRFEFCDPDFEESWVRVFLVHLPFQYKKKLEGCAELLFNMNRNKYSLWLVRADRIDGWEDLRPGQIHGRPLPLSTTVSLQAMLSLLEKRDRFSPELWADAEKVLLGEFKLTYLGEMFQEARESLDKLQEGTSSNASSETARAVK